MKKEYSLYELKQHLGNSIGQPNSLPLSEFIKVIMSDSKKQVKKIIKKHLKKLNNGSNNK